MSDSEYERTPEKHINFGGKDWRVIKSYIENRLDLLVGQLCQDLSDSQTNVIRGQIAALRDFIQLEKQAATERVQGR